MSGRRRESDEEMRAGSGCWERQAEVNLLQLLELMDSVCGGRLAPVLWRRI